MTVRYSHNSSSRLEQEARNYRDVERLRRVDSAYWFGRFIGWCFSLFWRFVMAWRVMIVWTVVSTIIYLSVSEKNKGTVIVCLVIALVALAVLSLRFPVLDRFMPIEADVKRMTRNYRANKTRREAYSFLEHIGVITTEDAKAIKLNASFVDNNETAVLELFEPVPGVSFKDLVKLFDDYKNVVNAEAGVRVAGLPNGGVRAVFMRENPLDAPSVVEEPKPLDPDTMSVVCAIDSDGEEQTLTFANNSGMVLGGVPGSGKTAGVTSFLLPLALSPYVSLTIYDGKDGVEWEPYANRAVAYLPDGGDFDKVLALLKAKENEMKRRKALLRNLGTANFWSASAEERLNAGLTFDLLVLDECQTILSSAGRSREDKQKIEQITRIIENIVRQGRSRGMFVLLLTQKPTADSIPTGIRDNCGLRACLRVTTDHAITSTLGDLPDDVSPDVLPTNIPSSRKGGGTLANEAGELKSVRFFYIPEDKQKQLLNSGVV